MQETDFVDYALTEKSYRGWFITTNNYTDQDLIHRPDAQYSIIGKEVCPTTGTRHIHNYVYYKNARSFSSIKKTFPRSNIGHQKGSIDQASTYCAKDGDYTESGTRPVDKRGQVNQWQTIVEQIVAGITLQELTLQYPEEAIRYANGIKSMYEMHRPKFKFDILTKYGKYNVIQEFVIDYVSKPIHDRHILWIYDSVGGAGKTDLANHLMSQNNFKVFGNAKTADVAFAWDGENVIFDYSRSQCDCINYGVVEDIKNGRIFSGKYQSAVKLYTRPHVIIFANFLPDYHKMSLDRWLVYSYANNHLDIVINTKY